MKLSYLLIFASLIAYIGLIYGQNSPLVPPGPFPPTTNPNNGIANVNAQPLGTPNGPTPLLSNTGSSLLSNTGDVNTFTPSVDYIKKVITVSGTGKAQAPVTRAEFNISINVPSKNFGTTLYKDIEKPFGVDYIPTKSRTTIPVEQQTGYEFVHETSSVQCSSCVQKEMNRRITSIVNYLKYFNYTNVNDIYTQLTDKSSNIDTTKITSVSIQDTINHSNINNDITELKTAYISVNPETQWLNGKSDIIGYIGEATLTFQVPTDIADVIINTILLTGATNIRDVKLIAIQHDRDLAQLESDKIAAKLASTRIYNVLNELNLTFNGYNTININGDAAQGNNFVNPPILMMKAMAAPTAIMESSDSMAGGGIDTGSNLVGDSVFITSTVHIEAFFK